MQDQIRGKTRNLARDLEPAGRAIGFFRSPLVFSLFSRGASPKWGKKNRRGRGGRGGDVENKKRREGEVGRRLCGYIDSYQVTIFQAITL